MAAGSGADHGDSGALTDATSHSDSRMHVIDAGGRVDADSAREVVGPTLSATAHELLRHIRRREERHRRGVAGHELDRLAHLRRDGKVVHVENEVIA